MLYFSFEGDVTDLQKEADTTSKSTNSVDSNSAVKSEETANDSESKPEAEVEATDATSDNKSNTPNSKQRLKLRQEEIKLSPIRNKSLSCSSLCDEGASSQKDDTMVSSVDGNEPSSTEVDLVTSARNDENKENDNGDQAKVKEAVNGGEEAIVTATAKSKRSTKADKNNLLAKLIAGVINKRLRRGQTSQENGNNKEDNLNDEEDQDDDFDADYSEGDEEEDEESTS